jgi:hypothetical protein
MTEMDDRIADLKQKLNDDYAVCEKAKNEVDRETYLAGVERMRTTNAQLQEIADALKTVERPPGTEGP